MALKTDYSFLFDSLNGNNNSNNIFQSINLAEYHNIKSGVYKKALDAYYDQQVDTKSDKDKTNDKSTKLETAQDKAVSKLTAVSTDASKLQSSAEALIDRGYDSVFAKEDGVYDVDKIYRAVEDFAKNYNSFISAMEQSDNESIEDQISSVTRIVEDYKNDLKSIGISINEKDNTLQLDETIFKSADMDLTKKLFHGNSSMAYVISTKASIIGVDANSEVNSMKNYTSTGNYSDTLNIGNLLNNIV